MKTRLTFKVNEKAQALPIIVMGMIAMIALAALLIDGGTLIANRRTAQAAADAGALAGARELCYPTGKGWYDAAVEYVGYNNAELATDPTLGACSLDSEVQCVHVKTKITQHDPFFARILNIDEYTAAAEAESGCFAPYGNYVLPVAWSCRPPITGGPFDPNMGCKIMALDWPEQVQPLISKKVSSITIDGKVYKLGTNGTDIVEDLVGKDGDPPPQIYIVMDKLSITQETLCKEDFYDNDSDDPYYDPTCSTAACQAAIVCDLDGNGKVDIEGGGNRGWLDLNGTGGGASEMVDWIENGLDFPIAPHTWLSGQPGTTNSVYTAMENRRTSKEPVMIPIFNAICDDKNPTTIPACMSAAHNPPWEPKPVTGDIEESDQTPQFHVITFDNFIITCVHQHQNDKCPGFSLAQKMNPDPKNSKKSLIPDNTPSVEGFFLTNVNPNLDPYSNCDINLGNCSVSLSK